MLMVGPESERDLVDGGSEGERVQDDRLVLKC